MRHYVRFAFLFVQTVYSKAAFILELAQTLNLTINNEQDNKGKSVPVRIFCV